MTLNFKDSCRFSDELKLSTFKCATCLNMLKPPVMLIEHTGNVCSSCFAKQDAPFTPNTTLDMILNNLIVSCKNISFGCQEKVRYDNLDVHMENCKFSPVSCLAKKCIWVGKRDTLPKHFYEYHEASILEDRGGNFQFKLDFEILKEDLWMLVVNEEAVYFLTVLSQQGDIIYRLYQVDQAPQSTVTLRHQGLGTTVCETKTQLDVLPLDSFPDGTGGVTVKTSGLKSALNLTKDVLVLLDFSYPNAIGQEILQFVQCICCFVAMRPPIYQCSVGHSLCSNCLPKLKKCPMCSGTYKAKIRNFALEALTEKCDYQCMYETEGCKKVCKGSAIEEHEKQCPHKLYPCPRNCGIEKCSQENLRKHFEVSHKDLLCETDSFTYDFIFKRDSLVNCEKYIFINNTTIHVLFSCKKTCGDFNGRQQEYYEYLCEINILFTQNKSNNFICKMGLKSLTSAREIHQTGTLNTNMPKTFSLLIKKYWSHQEMATFSFKVEDQNLKQLLY